MQTHFKTLNSSFSLCYPNSTLATQASFIKLRMGREIWGVFQRILSLHPTFLWDHTINNAQDALALNFTTSVNNKKDHSNQIISAQEPLEVAEGGCWVLVVHWPPHFQSSASTGGTAAADTSAPARSGLAAGHRAETPAGETAQQGTAITHLFIINVLWSAQLQNLVDLDCTQRKRFCQTAAPSLRGLSREQEMMATSKKS